jgi:hypothetical protein
MKFIDRTGQKFGRLTVVSVHFKGNITRWNCVCNCGKECIVSVVNLVTGHTISCGCYRKEWAADKVKTHGFTYHPLYRVWSGIISRCYNENIEAYKHYGGRGIIMCDEWRNDPKKFVEWGLENGWSSGLEIDRIENDGIYEPSNCRFVTPAVNGMNKRNTCKFELNGIFYDIHQLYNMSVGVPREIIRQRINRDKWAVQKAISTPIKK